MRTQRPARRAHSVLKKGLRRNARFPPSRFRMPQNLQSITDPSDFPPKNGRNGPAPITHLPVHAPGVAADPALEIRKLIEQLQLSARNARAESQTLQEEKEELSVQLENALRQVDQLRSNEREIRSQFVEVTSVIRERDSAVQEVERLRRGPAITTSYITIANS